MGVAERSVLPFGECQAFGFCIGLLLGGLFTIPLVGHLITMCTWLQMPHFLVSASGASLKTLKQRSLHGWGCQPRSTGSVLRWLVLVLACFLIFLRKYRTGPVVFCGPNLHWTFESISAVTASASSLSDASNITLLAISPTIVPTFVFWVDHQEIRSKPALYVLFRVTLAPLALYS